ncbi:MAG: MnmC family methyltransferase [Cyanobacteria bacterium P01_A01_bin.123]
MTEDPSFTPELTKDGSFTFFSSEFGEWFHSREGAYREARLTYVDTTQLADKAQTTDQLALLDVCYGLGYNTAAALDTIWHVNPGCQVTVIGLDLNPAVPQSAIAQGLIQGWSEPVRRVLAQLAMRYQISGDRLQAQLLIGDARQQIQTVVVQGFLADAIFLDPFSPPRCPQLWTVEFLKGVTTCLKPDGRLATYSCAAAVRAALAQNGLYIGATQAVGRCWPGTVASWSAQALPPLSQRELEHLQTRAAVPYRDRTLTLTAAEIHANRLAEQQRSPLEVTAQWRKRWL